MDPRIINSHKRTSIYEVDDYYKLVKVIGDINQLVVLPNIWTETDNLLKDFNRNHKDRYVSGIIDLLQKTSEKYIESTSIIEDRNVFYNLGLTDTLILHHATKCKFLITSDTKLSDHAIALNIPIYDMVKERNQKFK